MANMEAGRDRSGVWHVIIPKSESCEIGHKLRNSGTTYEIITDEGDGTIERRLRKRRSAANDSICRECRWGIEAFDTPGL